jgi:hypothetical protein
MKNSEQIAAENEALFTKLSASNKADVLAHGVVIGLKFPSYITKIDALEIIKNHYTFVNLKLRMSERT